MASRQARSVLAAVEILLRDRDERTDGDLLREFLDSKSEAAFAVLVRRHGAMVWGVCRRILGNADDTDDAVQATFLVLATKANSLKSRGALGDWLHGIARRTALSARRSAARRREMEKQIVRPTGPEDNDVADMLPILDEELARLPEKYRLPILLCDLEGQTRKLAAKQLRWPLGTVAGRLARGHQLLAQRLTRRGVSLTASALATALAANAAAASGRVAATQVTSAAVQLISSSSLAGSGVVSAKVLALTQGVLKTMLLSKLKTVTAVVTASLALAWGGGLIVHEVFVAQSAQAEKGPLTKGNDQELKIPAKTVANVAQEDKALKTDLERLQGTWTVIAAERVGKQIPEEEVKKANLRLIIKGKKFTGRSFPGDQAGEQGEEADIKIDPSTNPKTIDISRDGKVGLGIYEVDDDTLKICFGREGRERPTEFKTKPEVDQDQSLYVAKKAIEQKAKKPATNTKDDGRDDLAKSAPAARLIEGTLTIVELAPRRGEDGKVGKPLGVIDERELTGPGEKILSEVVPKLMSDGRAIGVRQLEFDALEKRQIRLSNSELRPYLSSATIVPNALPKAGTAQAAITQRQTGSSAIIAVRVVDDRQITLDLLFEDERVYPPEIGRIAGGKRPDAFAVGVRPNLVEVAPLVDGAGKEYRIYDFVNHWLKAKLTIPLGQTVVAKDIQAKHFRWGNEEAATCPPQIILIASARVAGMRE